MQCNGGLCLNRTNGKDNRVRLRTSSKRKEKLEPPKLQNEPFHVAQHVIDKKLVFSLTRLSFPMVRFRHNRNGGTIGNYVEYNTSYDSIGGFGVSEQRFQF